MYVYLYNCLSQSLKILDFFFFVSLTIVLSSFFAINLEKNLLEFFRHYLDRLKAYGWSRQKNKLNKSLSWNGKLYFSNRKDTRN